MNILSWLRDLSDTSMNFNPLTSRNDKHVTSPDKIHTLSSKQVMRINTQTYHIYHIEVVLGSQRVKKKKKKKGRKPSQKRLHTFLPAI